MRGRGNQRPHNRASLCWAYVRNRRVAHYEYMLGEALEEGYTLCSLEKSIDLFAKGQEKIVVLRHDVDQPSPGARAIFEAEQRLGVNSTFYFRWKTVSKALMAEMKAAGNEVSLHYETVADLAAEQRWQSRGDLLDAGGMDLAGIRLLKDLQRFRSDYDVPCRTVAGHGHVLNRTCQTLNNEILWPGGLDREEAGLQAEAYDPSYLKELDVYVSDTQLEINGGFRYGRTLHDAIAEGSSRILFLTHPNHWDFSARVRFRRVAKIILRGPATNSGRFAYEDWLRGRPRAGTAYGRHDFWSHEPGTHSENAGSAKS